MQAIPAYLPENLTRGGEVSIISEPSSIAQSAEQAAVNRLVPGSSPGRGVLFLIFSFMTEEYFILSTLTYKFMFTNKTNIVDFMPCNIV